MKRTGIRILAALLALAMLAGCTSGQPSATTAATTAAPAGTAAPATSAAATTAAAPAQRGKLVIGTETNNFITDYEDNYFTHYLEDLVNVDLDFYLLPADANELRTKISLMVVAKDSMPDILICNTALTREMVLDYGSKGAFIPLNKYIDDPAKSPNFAKVPADDKAVMLNAITSADGNIYSLPKYEPDTWNLTPYRYYINETWLNKVGKKVPTTTDELYDVLVAFRDGDPNGNGKKDEIGVYGYYNGTYGENTVSAIMNAFTFYNGGNLNGGQNGGLALDTAGSTVVAPFVTEEWHQGLIYMNKLYNEKLLAASMFTDDLQQFKATLNNEDNIVSLVCAGSYSNWPDANKNKNYLELSIIPPIAGPSGVCYTPYSEYTPSQSFFITSNCKNPDLAFKLGDAILDEEVSQIARNGEEGVDWSRDPADLAKTSNGYVEAGLYDALTFVTLTPIWSEPSNKFWHNNNPRFATLLNASTKGSLIALYDPSVKTSPLNAFNYEHYFPKKPEHVLPMLRYSIDEAQQVAEPVTNISTFVKQTMAEFITGARNVNTGWDAYLKELDNMGLQEWLKHAQAAYDRQK